MAEMLKTFLSKEKSCQFIYLQNYIIWFFLFFIFFILDLIIFEKMQLYILEGINY